MTNHARGDFEVKLAPQGEGNKFDQISMGRMSIDKQFRGDLEGASKGEMLTAMTGVKGSAGYVAIERIAGTLLGRTGAFVLQHSGTANRGAQQLVCSVVPDSGSGELSGITGTMKIMMADGKHSYEFEYSFVE